MFDSTEISIQFITSDRSTKKDGNSCLIAICVTKLGRMAMECASNAANNFNIGTGELDLKHDYDLLLGKGKYKVGNKVSFGHKNYHIYNRWPGMAVLAR